jgi:hypothetical protein
MSEARFLMAIIVASISALTSAAEMAGASRENSMIIADQILVHGASRTLHAPVWAVPAQSWSLGLGRALTGSSIREQ